MPASDVARHFDVSVRAVFKWVAAFYDGGQNALLAREGAGRPPKVSPDQLRWIADTVRDRTVVRATGQRVSVQMLSAVGMGGQLQFMLHAGLVNAAAFRTFLEQLMLGATQPIFLVVDGHSINKAKLVSEYVASTNGMLELHFLPPYSPQHSPDEQVWKSVKERVAKQKPLDKISLRRLIQAALERLQTLSEIVQGFFRHSDCARTI